MTRAAEVCLSLLVLALLVAPPAAASDYDFVSLEVPGPGAFATDILARARLELVLSKQLAPLSKASPEIEATDRNGRTLYRVRFAGLDADRAQAACNALQRAAVGCYALTPSAVADERTAQN